MKYGKILILVLIAFLVGVVILRVGTDTQMDIKNLRKSSSVTVKPPQAQSELIQAKLIIEKESPIEKKVEIKPNKSVFDLLQKSNIQFEYEQYDSGAFITSIEGISEPTKNWMYYVNNKLSQEAVDKKVVEDGDVIKFKNQRPPF
ncbi:MAG: DUF4430 domain-containing protein [Candidatus Paceibacterota bacterium]